MSYRLACAVLLSYTIWHFKMPHYSAYRVDSVWLCLRMSYRSFQNVFLGDTVWHLLRKSYRPPLSHMSFILNAIPFSHFISLTQTLLPLFLLDSFSSFCDKTCWFRLFQAKSLLVTLFNQGIITNCCWIFDKPKPWSTELDRVPRVRAILTDS